MRPPNHKRTIGDQKDMKYSSWHWKKEKAQKVAEGFRPEYYARVIDGKNEAGYTVYLVYIKRKK